MIEPCDSNQLPTPGTGGTETFEDPFLITIPGGAVVPTGWTVVQIGRSASSCDRPALVGLVCYDPLRHDLVIWLAGTAPGWLRFLGWQRAFTFVSATVWFRPRLEESGTDALSAA